MLTCPDCTLGRTARSEALADLFSGKTLAGAVPFIVIGLALLYAELAGKEASTRE